MAPIRPAALVVAALCAGALLLLPAPPASAAEGEAEEVGADVFGERIEVRLVGLDVWVTGEDGEPVTGLEADDFTVRHDGEPVEITHFSEVGGRAPVPAAAAPPGPAPADPTSAEPPPPVRGPSSTGSPPGHLVVYFDQNRLSPDSYPRVAEALERVLAEGVVPAERVLILRQDENLHLEVPFGSSAEEVAAAVERITSGSHRGLARASGLDQARAHILELWEHSESVARARPGACERFVRRAGPAVRSWTRERSADVARTLGNLDTAASLLAGLPGVKGVLYVSDGLDLAPGATLAAYAAEFCPDRGRTWQTRAMGDGLGREFLRLAAHLNARGVTLHAIQASGLGGVREGAASQRATTAPAGSGMRFEIRQRQASRSGMSLLANQTGGRAVFNRGNLAPEFAAIGRGLAHYYSLAFPPPEGSGPVYRVEVEVADPSLDVRYRRTIRATDPDERFEEGLASALHLGLVSNLHDLSLGVAETGAGGSGPALNLLIMVPLDRLLFAPEGVARVEVRALAVPLVTGGRASAPPVTLAEEFRLRRPADTAGSAVASQRATLPLPLPLPPGPHRLAVALRDALSGESSFVVTDLTVPGPPDGGPAGEASAPP